MGRSEPLFAVEYGYRVDWQQEYMKVDALREELGREREKLAGRLAAVSRIVLEHQHCFNGGCDALRVISEVVHGD